MSDEAVAGRTDGRGGVDRTDGAGHRGDVLPQLEDGPGPGEPASGGRPDLGALLAGADPADWGRLVLAVAAMYEPDRRGRCPYCRPEPRGRRWCRRRVGDCPTRRVMLAHLRPDTRPPGHPG